MLGDQLRLFDLSPVRSNSRASRHLMYCLPVSSYWFDSEHTNVTLHSILKAVVDDLNALASLGVRVGDTVFQSDLTCF